MSNSVTPTKVSTISVISPKSQNNVCVVCGSCVTKSDNRRRLYREGKKTTYCEEIEYVVGESLDPFLQTHVSCRSCREKAATLMKNLENYRKQFRTTQCRNRRKEEVHKRVVPCDSQGARKRVLFDSTNTKSNQLFDAASTGSSTTAPCQSFSTVSTNGLAACNPRGRFQGTLVAWRTRM